MSATQMKRAFTGWSSRVALAVVMLLVVVAVFAPAIEPHNPVQHLDIVNLANQPPSAAYPLGTDPYSRDVLSRVIDGTRTSLAVAGAAVLIALVMGTAVGALAGMAGGAVDRWLMRGVDAILSVPRLLVLIVISAALGKVSLTGLALVIGLTGWPAMSRLVRVQVREIAALDYVLAARALGVRPFRVFTQHVFPGVLPQILVAATLAVASVIPLEAGLAFLGLGVPLPQASWGNILLDAGERMEHWWLIVFPGLAIVGTVLAVNVVGERLREAIDPRMRPPL